MGAHVGGQDVRGQDDGGQDGGGLPGGGQDDGSAVWLDTARLRCSVNDQLLAQALVYPTLSSRLYLQLRTALPEQALGSVR